MKPLLVLTAYLTPGEVRGKMVFWFLVFGLFLYCGYPKRLPPPVESVSPAGDTLRDNNVTLVWLAGDFIQFAVEIGEDAKFKKLVYEDTTITDTTISVFLSQGVYYYRIKGKERSGGWGEWSDEKSFVVEILTQVGEIRLNGYPNDILVVENEGEGRFAFVAGGQAGLEVIDVSDVGDPRKVAEYSDGMNDLWGVKVSEDGYAYLSYGKKELLILDISDLTDTIFPVGSNEYSVAFGYDLEVDEGRELVYCAAREQFITFDVQDPAYPYDYKKENFPAVRGICLNDNYLYLACEQLGVALYETTDSFPIRIGYIDTPHNARDLFVMDSLLFVADGRALTIVSVRDKTSPYVVASIPVDGYTQKVFVSNEGYLFLACGSGGLLVYDCSSLPPRVMARCAVPYARSLFYKDGFLYLGERDRGLMIYKMVVKRQ